MFLRILADASPNVLITGTIKPMLIDYRPATPSDESFLYKLHSASMRAYVEATFGVWDESWQQERFHQSFHPHELQIIQADGQDIGVLHVQHRAEEIFIVLIEVHPRYQRRGIGAAVLRELQAQAALAHQEVALRVLRVNTQAQAFYRRLGFVVTGHNPTHYLMAWFPPESAANERPS